MQHTRRARPHARWPQAVALACWLALGSGAGAATPPTEPDIDQVYLAARTGHLDQAQDLVQQLLERQPNDPRARFVQAELLARRGDRVGARAALATAEQLAPGLPFVPPSVVQALRHEVAPVATATPPPARLHRAWRWAVPLAALGGALLAWLLMRLARPRGGPPP